MNLIGNIPFGVLTMSACLKLRRKLTLVTSSGVCHASETKDGKWLVMFSVGFRIVTMKRNIRMASQELER
jgi:hypothetical protein